MKKKTSVLTPSSRAICFLPYEDPVMRLEAGEISEVVHRVFWAGFVSSAYLRLESHKSDMEPLPVKYWGCKWTPHSIMGL